MLESSLLPMPAHSLIAPPPIDYVFVDFENIHEVDLGLFDRPNVRLVLLVGARQTKLEVSLVEKLLAHSSSVQLERLTGSGRNALDFALAYYMGRAAVIDPAGYFHIISKDTGFDPLVAHLRSRNIRAQRHNDFRRMVGAAAPAKAVLPALPAPAATKTASVAPAATRVPRTRVRAAAKPKAAVPALPPVLDDRSLLALGHLRKASPDCPKTLKKLISTLVARLAHGITVEDATAVVDSLSKAGHVSVDEKGRVTYALEPRAR